MSRSETITMLVIVALMNLAFGAAINYSWIKFFFYLVPKGD